MGDDLGELRSLGLRSDVVLGEIVVSNAGGKQCPGHVYLSREERRSLRTELLGRWEERSLLIPGR